MKGTKRMVVPREVTEDRSVTLWPRRKCIVAEKILCTLSSRRGDEPGACEAAEGHGEARKRE
jgi:hypothetical protein